MTTKAVAKALGTAVAAADDFSEFAGAGMENVTATDVLIPRITIVQALSPQLKKSKSEYIAEAEIGDIVDVGTGDLFQDGILFLPVFYKKEYLEWGPRNSDKGLVEIHSSDAIMSQTKKETDTNGSVKYVLPNGNYIAETAQWYGLNLTADARPSYIPMASSQLKTSRKWMTLATGEKLTRGDGSKFVAPLFYRTYNLTTAEASKGDDTWGAWKIDRGPALPELENMAGYNWEEIKGQAIKLREATMDGTVKADTSGMDGTSKDDEDGPIIEGEKVM